MVTGLDLLLQLANKDHLRVTSSNKGRHNTGSAHYHNRAIDIDHRNLPKGLLDKYRSYGIRVLDETIRPKGQQVWGGPHYHLEVAPNMVGQLQGLLQGALQPPQQRFMGASVSIPQMSDFNQAMAPVPAMPKNQHQMQATQSLIDGQWFNPDEWASFG